MASRAALTVFFGFYVVFCCLIHPLGESVAKTETNTQSSGLPRLAAAALVPAFLTTLALTVALLYAHVWALGRANARHGGAGARFVVARLADATLLAAVVALLSAAAVQLGGGDDGVLRLGGADDVGWLG
ncbi:unnamed protein product [Urochloa decumbens]|uniref:Uncharacterized protein n=1 Tax=Urochloa decumbens TaxID=240449 RepID=A0ABC9DS63_9POAL